MVQFLKGSPGKPLNHQAVAQGVVMRGKHQRIQRALPRAQTLFPTL